MSQAPTYEMLVGACAAHGLSREGAQDDLQKRLGDFLVVQLLFGKSNGKRVSSSSSPPFSSDTAKKAKADWHTFQKAEGKKVKEEGFRDRIAIVREVARRWKEQKINVPVPPQIPIATATEAPADPADPVIASVVELDEDETPAADAIATLIPTTPPTTAISSASSASTSSAASSYGSSESDENALMIALSDLTDDDISAALAANDVEDTGDREANLAILASIMM